MTSKIFIVTAARDGDIHKHSYVLGVFSKKKKAIKAADSHKDFRYGRYECIVDKCNLNKYTHDIDLETVYRTDFTKGG